MKITLQESDMALSRLASSSSASKVDNARHAQKKPADGDSVDTSRMSNMMSKSAQNLASLNTIRKEKIEAFKHIVDSPPAFSDAVIDQILYKLTSF